MDFRDYHLADSCHRFAGRCDHVDAFLIACLVEIHDHPTCGCADRGVAMIGRLKAGLSKLYQHRAGLRKLNWLDRAARLIDKYRDGHLQTIDGQP